MLGIKRFDHVSIATRDLEGHMRLFQELFGMKLVHPVNNWGEFDGVSLWIPGGDQKLELMQPKGENSFVARFMTGGGSMFHHVAFDIEDIRAAAAALRARGIEPFRMMTRGDSESGSLFIHPRDSGGVLIQLNAGRDTRDT